MLEFRLLGPLEVTRAGEILALPGQRQRALLALLLLRAGELVPSERLIDELWGEQPPRTAAPSLHNFVSQLRKLLGADVLETRPPGYVLRVDRAAIDVQRFELLLAQARAEPPEQRAETLRQALALWRGAPLAEFELEPFAQSEIRRLSDLRLAALEDRIEADLELGRNAEVIGELEALIEQEPLRERPRAQLMLALYRSGRQAQALSVYGDTRRVLTEELGIDPSAPLQQLHGSILRQEAGLELVDTAASENVDDEVLKCLLAGRVVPVLGASGATELAEELARAFDLDGDGVVDLARVSQRVATLRGSGPLYDRLHELFEAAVEPEPIHRFLASLPPVLRGSGSPHLLLVTTHYDLALERAFEDAGEEIDVVSYVASGPYRGKFWHRAPGAPPRPIDLPNEYATELSLERRTIVLKLRGAVDLLPEREWESFVITEDDHIDYLGRSELTAAVPVSIAATLRRSHFLFLGYDVVDWNLRLILGRIWGGRPLAYSSWAVQPKPNALERAFWRQREVDVLDLEPAAFVELLQRRIGRMSAAPASPYKGLRPFDDSDLDAQLFFGRERDREVIAANLLAAPLTVLYGPSGVGKSSVLYAGVARQLRELPENPLVVVFSSWAEAPGRALAEAIAQAAGIEEGGGLVEVLEEATRRHSEVFVILDQAEELFLYDEDGFVDEFPKLVNRPELRVNVLLSVRDDSLARLDVFKSQIPDVLGNYLRLDRLSRDAGRAAIVKPVATWSALANGVGPVDVEPELVEAVLDEVGAGRIDPGLGGRGAAEDLAGPGIETPYLQLVMQRVWDEELAGGSRVLRLETFERLGGAHSIVAEHLDAAISALSPHERDLAARFFNHLVTPSGAKVAHGVTDLAEYAAVLAGARCARCSTRLAERRILRTVARDERGESRYEIFHDVLAGAVLGWRSSHEADRVLEAERAEARRRHRRLATVALLALVAFAAMTALAAYAFALRGEARDRERDAQASATDARASALRANSAIAARHRSGARDAARPGGCAAEAERGGRGRLRAGSGVRTMRDVVNVGQPIRDLGASAGGSVAIATDDGSVLRSNPSGQLETIVAGGEGARTWLSDDPRADAARRDASACGRSRAGRRGGCTVPAGTRYVAAGPLGAPLRRRRIQWCSRARRRTASRSRSCRIQRRWSGRRSAGTGS